MIRSIKELCHYDIAAKDGSLGDVHDLFFDDTAWQVRYLVIHTGSWLPGRRVLVSPQAVETIFAAEEQVSVGLPKREIREMPGIEDHPPGSGPTTINLADHIPRPAYLADT